MKRVSAVVILVCIGTLFYLGWDWVDRTPEPGGEFQGEVGRAAGTRQPETRLDHTVRIAVITPQRRAGPGESPSLAAPVRYCVDRANAQGGVKSRLIDLLVIESENSALDSARAAREALDSGAVAVIGGYTSSGALASAQVLQGARIPFLATGATNPDVTRVGDCIFRVNFIDTIQGAVMATFARTDLGARTAAILVNVGNRYSPYLAEVFAEQFRQLGGEIVWQKDYVFKPGVQDAPLVDWTGQQAHVVFVPGYEDDSAAIIREARAAGVDSTFLGGDGWGLAMFDLVGNVVEGGYYTKAYHPDAGLTVGLQDILAGWIDTHGPIKRDSTVLALDACHLLLSAMERAETLSPEDIRHTLARTDGFPGIVGRYAFDSHGDPDKPLTILRLTRPNPVLVRAAQPKCVKMGLIFAKTGEAAHWDIDGLVASRHAVENLNRLGGVLGHRIEAVEYDNESTVLGCRKAALRAVQEGVAVVIGATWSSHSLAVAPILQEARIPMVSPVSTNPAVTRVGDFIFRVCYTDVMQAGLLAEFALNDLRAKTAAILTNVNSEYSLGLGQFFRERFGLGGEVVANEDYLQSTTDFIGALSRIRSADPDVLFVPGHPRDSVYIVRQARRMGIRAEILGSDSWTDAMYEYDNGQLEGCYFSQHWHPDLAEERVRKFVDGLAETKHAFRGGLAALTYDAVNLVADAIRRARSTDPERIRLALAETADFEGITGRIVFDGNRDPLSKPLVILRFGKQAAVFHKLMHPSVPRNPGNGEGRP